MSAKFIATTEFSEMMRESWLEGLWVVGWDRDVGVDMFSFMSARSLSFLKYKVGISGLESDSMEDLFSGFGDLLDFSDIFV